MYQNLTLQQFCSLDYNRNMVVTAGPGAGKTMILSHRFCFILMTCKSVTIPQILTLTFTEKAAEEMKTRIYTMLNQLDHDLRMVGHEEAGNRIREAIEKFHLNRISTIHSFCSNLLREHPVESGVDPGFAIIQGARQAKLIKEAVEAGLSRAWQDSRQSVIGLLQSFNGRSTLLKALRGVIAHPLIFKRILETRDRLFSSDNWEEQVLREYCGYIRDNKLIQYLNGLRSMEKKNGQYEELIKLMEDWHKSPDTEKGYYNVPTLFTHMRNLARERKSGTSKLVVKNGMELISYVDLLNDFYPDTFSSQTPDRIFGKQLDTFLQIAAACLDLYKKGKEGLKVLDFSDLESLSHAFLARLFEEHGHAGLKKIQQQFKYIMIDEFQDTNSVQWDIVSMLCSDRKKGGKKQLHRNSLFVVGDKRQAIYKFRGGDVTVFESVTKEIRESNDYPYEPMFWQRPAINNLIKKIEQDAELLKRHENAFSSLPDKDRKDILSGSIYLPHNFRTDPVPISFFNRVFDEIFSNKGAKDSKEYETPPQKIVGRGNPDLKDSQSGSVSLYLAPKGTIKRPETEAAIVVNIVERIVGRHGKDCYEYRKFKDIRRKIEKGRPAIGILFFAFSNLKIFENLFREADLPFRIHKGKGFFRCEEVVEIVQLLNYLADRRQQISLLAVLRSPIFGLTDHEIFDLFYNRDLTIDRFLESENRYIREAGRQIKRWRFLSGRMTIGELIRTVIADRSLTAVYSAHSNGKQRLANIEKLIEISREFQADGNGFLLEFSEYCIGMADSDEEDEGEALIISGGESPISLMTIHASKGLEFPMVIVPDLDRRLPSDPEPGMPLRLYSSKSGGPGCWNSREGELPLWRVEVPELGHMRHDTPLGYLLKRRERLEIVAENRRVFYVACTRSMNHLVLVCNLRDKALKDGTGDLNSADYRERARIIELLDDIFCFNLQFSPDKAGFFNGKDDLPAVIWSNPETKAYKGMEHTKGSVGLSDFGTYDNSIKNRDLTKSIKPRPYFQFSFNSIKLFRKCPVMFYYKIVLGLKMRLNESDEVILEPGSTGAFVEQEYNDREDYSSGDALLLGYLVHGYLEKHKFGEPIDHDLFEEVIMGLDMRDQDKNRVSLRERMLRHLETTICDKGLTEVLGRGIGYTEVPFLFSTAAGCEFRGIIDRLFMDRDQNSWTIIDWKSNDLTGKTPEDAVKENGYDLQLASYKWAVENILNEKVGDVYIYFTDTGSLVRSRCGESPEKVIREMVEKIKTYDSNRENRYRDIKMMLKSGVICQNCEFKRMCENRMRAMKL